MKVKVKEMIIFIMYVMYIMYLFSTFFRRLYKYIYILWCFSSSSIVSIQFYILRSRMCESELSMICTCYILRHFYLYTQWPNSNRVQKKMRGTNIFFIYSSNSCFVTKHIYIIEIISVGCQKTSIIPGIIKPQKKKGKC